MPGAGGKRTVMFPDLLSSPGHLLGVQRDPLRGIRPVLLSGVLDSQIRITTTTIVHLWIPSTG